MANTVEIEFRGRDSTGAAATSAINNTRRMSAEMKGLGQAFSQAGNLANHFGATALSGVISQLDSTVMSAAMLTKELAKSKLAFAALAAGATAGGFSIGEAIRKYIPFFNEVDKLEAANKLGPDIAGVQNQRLGLRDPAKAAESRAVSDINARLNALPKEEKRTEAERQLAFQLEQYRTELVEKGAEDRFQKESEVGFKLGLQDQQRRIETLAFENEFAAQKMAVRAWESEQRRLLDDTELASEEQKNESKVTLAKLAAAKIAAINAEQQKAEALKWRSNLVMFSNYTGAVASGLGQLASAMEQGGKKQFKAAKALRYGEAVMSTAAGIARCYADYPLWLAVPMSVIVAAAGAAQIGAIASSKGPQAHGGVDYVPEDQTVLLQQGERVIKRNQNERLMEMLDGGGAGGGGQMINLSVFLDGAVLFKAMGQASRDGRLTISARAVA